MSKRKKILIVGGKSYQDTKWPRIGGTTVLMDNYLEYCDTHDVPYVFVSTNKHVGRFSGVRNSLSMLLGVLRNSPKCSVIMVNISSHAGIHRLLPMAIYMGKIFGMKAVCRKFAGSIHHYLESKPSIKKKVFGWLRQTKVSFFETKELIDYFKSNDIDVVWFPNVRKPNGHQVSNTFDKKFVFVSHVREGKGIDLIIEASKQLPEGYTVDIYGPICDEKYSKEYFDGIKSINYKGVLKSEMVTETLSRYNVLLLPTFLSSEGYPGIVIEAMSVGMPVITTPTGGIVELIEDDKNGMLIPRKDADALRDAILSYDQDKYNRHVLGANELYGENYNADTINAKVTDLMLG